MFFALGVSPADGEKKGGPKRPDGTAENNNHAFGQHLVWSATKSGHNYRKRIIIIDLAIIQTSRASCGEIGSWRPNGEF
jgi:hypothetical protein